MFCFMSVGVIVRVLVRSMPSGERVDSMSAGIVRIHCMSSGVVWIHCMSSGVVRIQCMSPGF